MKPVSNIFSSPQRLSLTGTERTVWLESLLKFLCDNPTHMGRVLMGGPGPWGRTHVRELELLICSLENREAIRNYLSIMHEAARLWSADTLKRVPLPHFLPRETQFDNPFTEDFATAALCCANWKQKLATLITFDHSDREARLASFLLSAILNGRALGGPLLVALVRAIPVWKRRTFKIGGRVHVELSLSRRGVLDAEHRIWLPDALTAVLMTKLQPDDTADLLAPVTRNDCSFQPSDAAVMRRIGRLIGQFRSGGDQGNLPGLEAMRRSAREIALVNGLPTFVAYDWTELASESLRRGDVPRLFPGDRLMEFIEAETSFTQAAKVGSTDANSSVPEWRGILKGALHFGNPGEALGRLVSDPNAPAALRLIADFAIALRLRTSRPGKPPSNRAIEERTLLLGDCVGHLPEFEDLAKLPPADRRTAYVNAINDQPARKRPDAVQAVREFDLFLVAKFDGTLPIPRNSLPWFRKPPAFDPNIITHSEYESILQQLEDQTSVKSSERKTRMTLLTVILAFRCMLRRGELRGLRIEDVLLLLDDPTIGDPEIHVRHRREDPLKTPAAERRLPVQLMSVDELRILKDWLQARLAEKAKAKDYFFAIPDEGIRRIPRSFFDSLNERLRELTPYAAGGKGVHLHHFRHAGGAWLFAGTLWAADSQRRRQLFPELKEFHIWVEQNGRELWEMLCGNPSKRLPYALAKICGHANFDTTAGSYINIFPWLSAHDVDGNKPDERDLLRVASGASRKKFGNWLRAGGPHNVAVQVMIGEGLRVKPQSPSNDVKASDVNGLIAIWRDLVRRSKGMKVSGETPDLTAMFNRTDWMMAQLTHGGDLRHPLEPTQREVSPSERTIASAAPLRPPHPRNAISPSILRLIREQSAADRVEFADAIGAFASFHERDGFVAFENIGRIVTADRYIRLLGKLGFRNSELEMTCSAADSNSEALRAWRSQLVAKGHRGLQIQTSPPGGSYAPRGSLWVRPSQDALRARTTGPSGFRFLMEMAFIIFGQIPKAATVALSPAPE